MTTPPPAQPNPLLRGLRQAPWRTQTQGTSLIMATVVLVAVIGALYLAQASRTAGAGRRLQQLETRRQALEQENAQLRAEIAALRSVPRLIREAEALGYHQANADEVDYVPVHGVAAPPPALIIDAPVQADPLNPEDDVLRYDETLESYLSERLADFREQAGDFFEQAFQRSN